MAALATTSSPEAWRPPPLQARLAQAAALYDVQPNTHRPAHTPKQRISPRSSRCSPGSTPRIPRAKTARRGSRPGDPLAAHGYTTLGPIAAGAFSQVNRARHASTRSEVAVKTFVRAKCAKQPHLAMQMKSELRVLKMLKESSHANLANLLELCETPQITHAILEYCSGGSLHRAMQTNMLHRVGLPEGEAASIGCQLCSALSHMHSLGIVHRDLKPENVLFTDGAHQAIKLCDFGFAKHCADRRLRTVCGSPQYMAPEVNGRESYAGFPVDLWALGALLYEVRTRTLPRLTPPQSGDPAR